MEDEIDPPGPLQSQAQLLTAGQLSVRGNAMLATNTLLTIPSSLQQQASWEFDLAMCQLEGGLPEAAAEHLTTALTLDPDLAVRPIAAYYLQKLGKPVPPPREGAGAKKPAASAAGNAPTSPAVPLPSTSPSIGPVPEPAKPASPTEPAKTKTPGPETSKPDAKTGTPKASP